MAIQYVRLADGSIVEAVVMTKAEANDIKRKPLVKTALLAITGNQVELTDWLMENEDGIESAFDTGTIRRVTKAESKKLRAALDHVVELGKTDVKLAFLAEHADAAADSFRWPTVKRMTEEEKATAARNTLTMLAEGRTDVAEWVLQNKTALLDAFAAGVEKRVMPVNAAGHLAAYQAKRAAEKEARAVATAEGPEALAAFEAKIKAERKAEQEAKAAKAAAAKAAKSKVAED